MMIEALDDIAAGRSSRSLEPQARQPRHPKPPWRQIGQAAVMTAAAIGFAGAGLSFGHSPPGRFWIPCHSAEVGACYTAALTQQEVQGADHWSDHRGGRGDSDGRDAKRLRPQQQEARGHLQRPPRPPLSIAFRVVTILPRPARGVTSHVRRRWGPAAPARAPPRAAGAGRRSLCRGGARCRRPAALIRSAWEESARRPNLPKWHPESAYPARGQRRRARLPWPAPDWAPKPATLSAPCSLIGGAGGDHCVETGVIRVARQIRT
jgi:hypothetical protein